MGNAISWSSETNDGVTECSITDIKNSWPDNIAWVYVIGISMVDMVIQEACEEIMGTGDGMHVTGEVQVDVISWYYL